MLAADVPEATAVVWSALIPQWPQELQPTDGPGEEEITRREGRLTHFIATDPDGAWVAEAPDGTIAGAAHAIRRERLWGLSMLGVATGLQGQGIGARLMAHALAYAEPGMARMIVSSHDPRALRTYHRAGLAAHPTMDATGQVNRSRIPTGLASTTGDPTRDGERVDAVARAVRGAAYGPDIAGAIESGCRLLVCGDEGFALERNGEPYLVAARTAAVASDLAWSCLALAEPGATVFIGGITSGNDWAITVALDAGFSLASEGALFTDRVQGPLTPFLPSGFYL